MDELQQLAERLVKLMKDRQPGLMSWLTAVQDTIDEIAKHRSDQKSAEVNRLIKERDLWRESFISLLALSNSLALSNPPSENDTERKGGPRRDQMQQYQWFE